MLKIKKSISKDVGVDQMRSEIKKQLKDYIIYKRSNKTNVIVKIKANKVKKVVLGVLKKLKEGILCNIIPDIS